MVEEGSSGFLGIGARPYKVRVMPRPGGAPREPDYREERSRRRGGRARAGERGERGERGGRGRRTRLGERAPRAQRNGTSDRPGRREAAPVAANEDDEGRSRRRRGRRGGRGRRGERRAGAAPREVTPAEAMPVPAPAAAGAEAAVPSAVQAMSAPREESAGLSAGELSERAREATERLLAAMGFDVKVEASAEDDRVNVAVDAPDDDDLLTGRKGEVRQALQHLLNRMINRGEGNRYHLQLEINDFWERREHELREIARGLADEAVNRNGEAISEYLNAQERRVLHVTLREDSRVKTYALGTGLIKRVAVAPADFPGGGDEGH